MSGQLARRYARAVLKLSSEQAQLETWGGELERLGRAIDSPELLPLLTSPEIPHERRLEAIAKIAERLDLSFPIRSFALVLMRHGHTANAAAIAQAYLELLDEKLGRARAVLTFAIDPTARQIETIVNELGQITGKKITAKVKVDSTLIGGIVAELEGRIYDASLAARLKEIEHRLST